MRLTRLCIIMAFVSLATGCNSDTDVVADQRAAILKYLDKPEKPETAIKYVEQGGIFKHTVNADRPDYDKEILAKIGDSIYFDYEAYTFSPSMGKGTLFYTNKKELVDESFPGVNQEFWAFESKAVKVGSTPLMKGLNSALPGCRANDRVEVYITSNLAFGNKSFGVLSSNTPVVYVLNIKNVIKQ